MMQMTVAGFQKKIEEIYYARDSARGIARTFQWFVEEVGELARGLRDGDQERLRGEFADVLAWLATLASLAGVDLESAALSKYGAGCPKCGGAPCNCKEQAGER
jgi:NTP pyrophosphatase (non-canonical NTP hydrolase)